MASYWNSAKTASSLYLATKFCNNATCMVLKQSFNNHSIINCNHAYYCKCCIGWWVSYPTIVANGAMATLQCYASQISSACLFHLKNTTIYSSDFYYENLQLRLQWAHKSTDTNVFRARNRNNKRNAVNKERKMFHEAAASSRVRFCFRRSQSYLRVSFFLNLRSCFQLSGFYLFCIQINLILKHSALLKISFLILKQKHSKQHKSNILCVIWGLCMFCQINFGQCKNCPLFNNKNSEWQ